MASDEVEEIVTVVPNVIAPELTEKTGVPCVTGVTEMVKVLVAVDFPVSVVVTTTEREEVDVIV